METVEENLAIRHMACLGQRGLLHCTVLLEGGLHRRLGDRAGAYQT